MKLTFCNRLLLDIILFESEFDTFFVFIFVFFHLNCFDSFHRYYCLAAAAVSLVNTIIIHNI